MTQPVTCTDGDAYEPDLIAPHDIEAEGVVLSHCLIHGILLPPLQPKHFYADANRYIYAAMQLLAQRGEPIDLLAVVRELRAQNRLKQVGGSSYVAMIHQAQPATAYPERDAAVIRELYARRTLSDVALRLRVELRTGGCTSKDAWEWIKAACRAVAEE